MTLGTAVLLFLLVLAGIVVVPIFLREKERYASLVSYYWR